MPWAFTGGPVDVGHGRYGRLDAGNGAEVPGMAQKRAEGLHLVAKNYQPPAGFTVVLTTPGPLSRIPLDTQ